MALCCIRDLNLKTEKDIDAVVMLLKVPSILRAVVVEASVSVRSPLIGRYIHYQEQ